MSVLLEIEIPCILLFLNRNRNSQNGPKRMHPMLLHVSYLLPSVATVGEDGNGLKLENKMAKNFVWGKLSKLFYSLLSQQIFT